MNLETLFLNTNFPHVGGTEKELQVAEYLKAECEELGVKAHIEGFRVAMADMEEAHVYADGEEITCKGVLNCGSGTVEGELYYMPGIDPVSIAGATDKVVLVAGAGVTHFVYQDLMKAGAKAILFQYGNVNYPNTDIDQRDLREAVVGEERKVLCGFPIEAKTGVYPSDSTPFADSGVPAVSFARLAGDQIAPIHCRYDTMEVMSMKQLQKDIDFLNAFADRMVNAVICPVEKEIPENIKKELDEYMNRKRK